MENSTKFGHIIFHKYFPIFILICINLIVGAFILTDYGESWDEHLRYGYAEDSLNAYLGIESDLTDEKGPFFVMLAFLGSDLIQNFCQNCLIGDLRHYINFLSFLLGLFFLYRLSSRYVHKWAAFGGVLLFNTQPLLWGHAFVNPKDIPFMAFFIASVDIGLSMADAFHNSANKSHSKTSHQGKGETLISHWIADWNNLPVQKRRWVLTLGVIGILTILVLLISQSSIQSKIEILVLAVYNQNSYPMLNTIFEQIADNLQKVPVESYVQKSQALYEKIIRYFVLAIISLFFLLILKFSPGSRKYFWHYRLIPFLKNFWMDLKNPKVIAAGIALGFASSIRTLGPASGILVSFYLIAKEKYRALPIITAYLLIGAITTYISWPGLWDAPISNYLDSLFTASDFPWGGKVLFNSIAYEIGTLPLSYLPVLLTIQITLTALITILAGFAFAIIETVKNKTNWEKIAVITLWFLAPIGMAIITQPKMYDNFRHFLFAIPPLFVFAAICIQTIYNYIKRPIFRTIIILILIIPNLYQITQLHPYQYVYYNALVGGVDGTFRRFEMDYWAISYREAIEYLNQNAPLNSTVIIYGPIHLVETYARPDLETIKFNKSTKIDNTAPLYAIILSRYDKDIQLFPDAENLYFAGKGDAVFTVVKLLSP